MAAALRAPPPSRLEQAIFGCGGISAAVADPRSPAATSATAAAAAIDPGGNEGPPTTSTRLWRRLLLFAEEAAAAPHEILVAVGHSRWMREFFKAFLLPAEASSPASLRKLCNGGVLSLRFLQLQDPHSGLIDFCVERESLRVLHGEFL